MRAAGQEKPRRSLRGWLGNDAGAAAAEFVIVFPLIMFLFFSTVEVGIYMMRWVMLDRAVDMNVRALRLGTMSPMTADELKRRVCADTRVLQDCLGSISVELFPVSTETWTLPAQNVACVDRAENIDPVLEFTPGTENELMVVRVCLVADPVFPVTPLVLRMPLDASGGYALASVSTFVNEP